MRAVAILAVALLAGCGNPDRFSLHLAWSDTLGRQICPMNEAQAFSCTAIPVSCDALVRLRIVDDADDSRVFFNECFPLPAGGDLCGLGGLQIPPGIEIPNQMVRIQLQVWSVDQLIDPLHPERPPACPLAPEFDEQGLPLLDAPTPAVGGEIYFPVGKSEVAQLRLGCPDYDQLDTDQCRNRQITVDAAVLVPGSWRSVNTIEAMNLDVRFGRPIQSDDGVWRLPLSELTDLVPTDDGELRWRKSVPGPIDGLRCLHVLQGEELTTAVATCQDPVVLPAAVLPMIGFRVERQQLEKLTLLQGSFPTEGLVLGLVVDADNHPVAGVAVTPSTGTVIYPNVTLDGLEAGATSVNGLFLSVGTPLLTRGEAAGTDGSIADGSARGGQIAGHLTIVVVRMRSASTAAP